ncbi:hypothetical protein L596_024495 [Steinernema carpocapsae]|uniref:Uncharacterized protein n=1 Tax=Steinernema carpocapsae TaxID=34508 RepID=A0A4V5ZZR0_STECR|nr:hypothetical protein L596_024495 [Steinernema carpocapsae]
MPLAYFADFTSVHFEFEHLPQIDEFVIEVDLVHDAPYGLQQTLQIFAPQFVLFLVPNAPLTLMQWRCLPTDVEQLCELDLAHFAFAYVPSLPLESRFVVLSEVEHFEKDTGYC